MSPETQAAESGGEKVVRGNGSIAHSIIGGFIDDLAQKEGYGEIAKKLEETLLSGAKPTDITLRLAMFGEDAL
ncbi:hypothetical protein [Herbaspirillum sp. alder98]|uniref:hypothetical protein n=1 Tax=Herbaspirillum sp. alder98 TaxID=2913096 RepID=UPI001CD8A862|nr:hypothetical protein [Herbaspirillum sp. alder98]MCA1326399.1 hypothetical protein [Herbaspirillum sp. alder98]